MLYDTLQQYKEHIFFGFKQTNKNWAKETRQKSIACVDHIYRLYAVQEQATLIFRCRDGNTAVGCGDVGEGETTA